MLTLRQLQYFVALTELRHFGKAAERCCVTQPALSMQIKELEDELGVCLVSRKRGSLELTADGRDIAARAQLVLNTVRDLQEAAHHRAKVLAGDLRLGVIPSVAPYLLPKVLPELRTRYPELQLILHETLTATLVQDLVKGSLDAIILALPVSDPYVETVSLFEDKFLLARKRTGRPLANGQVHIDALKEEKLLLLNAGHCMRDQALNYCTSIDRSKMTEFGATSLSTLMEMVAAGYGVTLIPEIAARSEITDSRVELHHFVPPEPKRTIGLVWRKTSTRTQDFIALAHLIMEVHQRTTSNIRKFELASLEPHVS